VSALMAVRDGAHTVSAALASVLAWGPTLGEVVVVDDGSQDRTPQLLRSLAREEPRLRVLSRPAEGLVPALNAGLALCRGRYVARMDADDIACPQRLSLQLPLLEADPSLVLVDGQVDFFRDQGEVPEGMRLLQDWINAIVRPEDFERSFSVESPVVHPAATFRRQAVLEAGGYRASAAGPELPRGPVPEDYDLWLRLQASGWRFRKVERVLVRMRDRPKRLTRTHPAYGREAFRRARMLWLEATALREPRHLAVWGAGKEARPWIRWLLARGHRIAAVIDIDPRKIGSTRHGIPIVPPQALPGLDAELCLVAVAARGARPLIRQALSELRPGWREGRELWFLR
jgi:glycosyltransferase involved in cell wall biosynthesis